MRRSRPSPSLRISTARKAVRLDLDVELLDRRDQHVPAVGLAPQDGREQADHRRPPDRRALVIPGAVAGDAHARMAAALRIPLVDRRQPALVDQLLQLGEADPLQLDRRTALRHRQRHWIASPRRSRQECRAMADERTAIVTGAGKRVGARSRAPCWRTAGPSSRTSITTSDEVPDGAVKVVADLADPDCAETIFAAAAGLPPVRLAGQQRRALRLGRLRRVQRRRVRRAHGGQRPRAGAADRALRRASTAGGDALVVNLLDSKLAAPNPDYLSYTLSKQALAGLTELAARALAPRGHPRERDRPGADACARAARARRISRRCTRTTRSARG